MTWTWQDEKQLGVAHLERMAGYQRRWAASEEQSAALYREWADRADGRAARCREIAERYEQAATEVRQETPTPEPLPAVSLYRHLSRFICGVATAAGLPCRRAVHREGARCWQHPEDDR